MITFRKPGIMYGVWFHFSLFFLGLYYVLIKKKENQVPSPAEIFEQLDACAFVNFPVRQDISFKPKIVMNI